MKTILVVCGNHRQFNEYIADKLRVANKAVGYSSGTHIIDGIKYVYIDRPDKMNGFHNVEVEFYGTWHALKDANQIQDLAEYARRP